MSISVGEAEALLGLNGRLYSAGDVDRAFKRFAKRHHPDVCESYGIDRATGGLLMITAAEARDLLRAAAARRREADSEIPPADCVADARNAGAACEPEPVSVASGIYCERQPAAGGSAKEGTVEPRRDPLFVRTAVDFVYGRQPKIGFSLVSLLILILGWLLPFCLFGGLNIVPSWEGLFVPDAGQFLLFYLVIPTVVLLNLVSPIHFVEEALRLFAMLVLLPLKKVLG